MFGYIHTYVENYDGFWEEWYNEDTGEFEEFFYYSTYYPSDAVIRINYKDGTSITANVGDEVDGYAIGWNDYQYLHPWTVGTDNQSTVTYLGVTVNLPITVVETLIGDVNRDGVVNAKDVASLRRHLAGGWDVTIDEAAADVNSDGAINAKDVATLRRYLAGGWNVELG